MEIIEKTVKDLEHHISLETKAETGFERTDSSFGRSSTVDQMLLHSISLIQRNHLWKEESIHEANFTVVSF